MQHKQENKLHGTGLHHDLMTSHVIRVTVVHDQDKDAFVFISKHIKRFLYHIPTLE